MAQGETQGYDISENGTGVILSEKQRNHEYWKAAVAYHERELATQRRLLRRAKAKLNWIRLKKEVHDDIKRGSNSVLVKGAD